MEGRENRALQSLPDGIVGSSRFTDVQLKVNQSEVGKQLAACGSHPNSD